MIKSLFFLSALALSQALTVPHPDCPEYGHWLLPHEYDCTKFYYCENGQKFVAARDCAPGTEFSPTIQVCIHPSMAGCELPGYPPSSSETEEPETDIPVTTAAPTAAPTQAPTTAAPTTAAPTTAAPTTAAPTTAAPTTAAPTTAAPTTAAPTTAAPTTAAPTATPTAAPTATPTATPTEASTTAAPITPTGAPTATPDLPDCSEESDEETNKCEEECNVLPWAHDDCDKFWICNDRKPALVVCAEGLRFNANTYTCDFACNVDCDRESIQTTAGSDGLRIFLPWDQIDNNTRELLKLIAK